MSKGNATSLGLFRSSRAVITLLLIHLETPRGAASAQAPVHRGVRARSRPPSRPNSAFTLSVQSLPRVWCWTAHGSPAPSQQLIHLFSAGAREAGRRLSLLQRILQKASCIHLLPWGWPPSLCDPVFSTIFCTDPPLQAIALAFPDFSPEIPNLTP